MTSTESSVLVQWLLDHDLPQRIVLMCHDAPTPGVARGDQVFRVLGCVSELSIAVPAQAMALGVPAVCVVPCAECQDEALERVAQWTKTITGGLEIITDPQPASRWRKPTVVNLAAPTVSRRGLMGLRSHSPFDVAADETARTLAALDALAARGWATQPDDPETSETTTAAKLTVSGCTACGVCVQACPHDALSLQHTSDVSVLSHAHAQCRGELACQQLCPVNAIESAGFFTLHELWERPVGVVAETPSTVCPRCRARHPGEPDTLCPTCEFRTSNVFGSALPPEAIARLGRS